MKKILTLLTAIFTFVSMSLPISAQVRKLTETHGLLYKISGKKLKKPSFLYGTIHIICQNDMFGLENLNNYIDQTDQVLMELDMDDPSMLQSMTGQMSMPDGKTLKDYLTNAEYAKVDEMFKNYLGVSVEQVKTIRPMFLSVIISTSPKSMGCQTPGSYELSLTKTATDKKKSIEGLETVALQFEKVDRKPFAVQAKEIYEMALNPEKSINEFREMIAVYKTQNSENLYQLITGKLGTDDVEKALLDERNIDWIPKIEKAISKKSTFIAVGGGHLGGKNGVLKLLKKKGYKIEAIKL